jgi:prepilin-type N-terminal cleavage/methylation domain-containing protein
MSRSRSTFRPLSSNGTQQQGFTLIELIITVVLLGILTAIAIPAYLSLKPTARENAAKTDLATLRQVIEVARMKNESPLVEITGSICTRCAFTEDPLRTPKGTGGWIVYNATLKKISDASGVNITNLLDPYGRPYLIDENESQTGPSCNADTISATREEYSPNFSVGQMIHYRIEPYNLKCREE